MDSMTDEKIQKIISVYKKQRDRDKKRYDVRKNDPVFMEKNRERARLYHQNHRNSRKQHYEKNIEYVKARNLLNYYKANNRIEEFKNKYPKRIELLSQYGVII